MMEDCSIPESDMDYTKIWASIVCVCLCPEAIIYLHVCTELSPQHGSSLWDASQRGTLWDTCREDFQ